MKTKPATSDQATTTTIDGTRAPLTRLLEELYERNRECREGKLADYIPELTRVDPDLFGIVVMCPDGRIYEAGRTQEPVTVQSVSKAFVFGLALQLRGRQAVADRVGVEPSGDAFNSIIKFDETGRPPNAMINAGAIATTDLIPGTTPDERLAIIQDMFAKYIGRRIRLDVDVFDNERNTAHRNRAIAHLLKQFNRMEHPIEESLDLYLKQCAMLVTARDLAAMGATLANGGVNPLTGERAIDACYVADVLSVMYTCGMYDYAGTWAYSVGLPAKSGVGGGVVAVAPRRAGIATVSPLLDAKGNSVRGIKVCKALSQNYGLHTFDPRPDPFDLGEAMEPYDYDGR